MARGKVRHSKTNKRKTSKKGKKYHGKKRNSKNSQTRDVHIVEKHKRRQNSEDAESTSKRKKVSDTPRIEADSDDSMEENDIFKKFLGTFAKGHKESQNKAVESDTEEEVTDDEIESEVMIEPVEKTDSTVQSLVKDEINNSEDENDSSDGEPEEVNDDLDPFVRHFQYDLNESLLEVASSLPACAEKQNWSVIGQFIAYIPKPSRNFGCKSDKNSSKVTIEEEKKYAKVGTVPQRISKFSWSQLHVKTQIHNNISKANINNCKVQTETFDSLTPLQKELFCIVNNYQDLYYPERTLKNGEEIRFIYCLHSVNHILKTRTKILHHNNKLSNKHDIPEDYRDQGLVRPKVVILVPFRESALRVVKMIMDILLPDEKANIINKKRFFDEFTGSEIAMPKKKPRPEDYEETFVGNTDDTFRIGLTITKKSLKLYADFYNADIIIASPLGLRVIVGAEGEEERDFDFLASVELLVLDQTELFLMQNWDHLLHVLDHFHMQPKEAHGTNFARVRTWALNGWSRYYRQTLMFSSMKLPEFNALMNKKCKNYAGKICVVNPILTGSICHVVHQLPQVFHRLDVQSVAQAIDARFDFFIKKILPQYKDAVMNHVLIYMPSYFDYVRLRNYFKKEDLNFVQICEYSKDAKIARARDMFFHAEAHFLLYSERFHFFRRPTIKGILHILFYQPPTFPHFYSEMCNFIQDSQQNKRIGSESNVTVTVLYSKYDIHQLAAIVGSDRASQMVNSDRNVHMFMTGV